MNFFLKLYNMAHQSPITNSLPSQKRLNFCLFLWFFKQQSIKKLHKTETWNHPWLSSQKTSQQIKVSNKQGYVFLLLYIALQCITGCYITCQWLMLVLVTDVIKKHCMCRFEELRTVGNIALLAKNEDLLIWLECVLPTL